MMDYLSISDDDIDDLERFFSDEWSFDENRRSALKNHDDVQACPGSGKTTLVSAKLILLAQKWREKHKGICVLTHTKTARKEILQKLQNHPYGFHLLSYPHFIGTIQEFVDKFLALPLVRGDYEFKRFSENDEAQIETVRAKNDDFPMNSLCGKLYRRCNKARYLEIENYVATVHYTNSDFDLAFFAQNGTLLTFRAANKSATYILLEDLKNRLNLSGVFQFRDMYAYGEKLIQENPVIKLYLRKRFPIVLIDEMQDTQNFQDELLNKIFVCSEVIFQRFGDPDQAIFDGMNGEKPNESYNGKEGLVPIGTSHRFGNDIAFKIKGLSFNKLENLESIRNPSEGRGPHTIFLYDNQSIKKVLPEFGDLAFESLKIGAMTEDRRKKVKVKAVGSVGAEKPTGLTIKHYWSAYDKSKTPKSFKATKLINIVRKCSEQEVGNVSDNYGLLLQGILDFLRKANKKFRNQDNEEIYYSKTTLLKDLQVNGRFENFRRLLTTWLMSGFPDRETWITQTNNLKSLLSVSGSINSDARDFLVYDPFLPVNPEAEEEQNSTNIYKCSNGVEIEVATIHAVKGETHDATLILETKFGQYFYDLQSLLDFFIDDNKERPIENHDSPRLKPSLEAAFLKRLYVAASRPKHLLCLAIHKNHISNDQINALGPDGKGWRFHDLTT